MYDAIELYHLSTSDDYGHGLNKAWALKHFNIVANEIMSDEKVYMSFCGVHNYINILNNDLTYAYVLTNKQLVVGHKCLIGYRVHSVNMKCLNDVKIRRGILWSTVIIDTFKEKIKITTKHNTAQNIYQGLLNCILYG